MLGKHFRFAIENQTGANITAAISVKLTPFKFGTDGALVYGAQKTVTLASVNDTVTGFTTVVDNSSDLHIGAVAVLAELPLTAAATGDVYIYLQKSDDGSNWADVLSVPVITVTDITAAKVGECPEI